jgi:hypothetical protein
VPAPDPPPERAGLQAKPNIRHAQAPAFDTAVRKNGLTVVSLRHATRLAGHSTKTDTFRIPRSGCYIAVRVDLDSGRVVGESSESNNVRWAAGIGSGCPGDGDKDGLEDRPGG